VETNEILRDGGVKGLFIATAVIASPRTVAANRAIAFVHAVYRFADGDLYVDGLTSFGTQTGAGRDRRRGPAPTRGRREH
jgi:hypothetical protein